MAEPLSMDLRTRVLGAVADGASGRRVGDRFGVSAASVSRWRALERTQGDASPKAVGGDRRSQKTETHAPAILSAVEETPDITIEELRQALAKTKVVVSYGALWRFLDRHKITRKKSRRMAAATSRSRPSVYDDEVTRHYQFPRRYLETVQRCVGDRIVFRRPRADGGNLAYFACALVSALEPDPDNPSMTFAHLGDFMQFDHPVPWTIQGRYWEEDLRNIPQQQVGVNLRGRSVRPLSEDDFAAIVAAGLSETLAAENAERLNLSLATVAQANADLHSPPGQDRERRVERVLTNRTIRDASFRGLVCGAYEGRCAVTRLRMLDVGNNVEAQAAHIWAVSDGGPDVIQNGIALSATVHWLFDRHLITIGDDYRLIIALAKVPTEFQAVYAEHGRMLHIPANAADRPHPSFLQKHRAVFFAKNGL